MFTASPTETWKRLPTTPMPTPNFNFNPHPNFTSNLFVPPAPVPTNIPTPVPSPPFYSHITHDGQNALWAGFVIFFMSTLLVAVIASRHKTKERTFHYLTGAIVGISALSYYAMATGSGYTYVNIGRDTVQGVSTQVFRQVFWVRGLDWALTTPLLLLELGLLAGLPWVEIFLLLIADEAMVLTGLFAALHPGRVAAKWGWYTFRCLFLVLVLFTLIWRGRKCAKQQHTSVSGLFTQLSIYTLILWLIYPIVFALGEGDNRISPDGETITYTILDIFSKIVFGIWLLATHKHDNDVAVLPEYLTEVRGSAGAIQLPAGED